VTFAYDARVTRETAVQTIFVDNDRVRVSEWRFAPGAETGHHRHEYDYVVVPIANGVLRLQEVDGEREAPLTLGVPYFREEGVEHNVINGSSEQELAFVEIEIKPAC